MKTDIIRRATIEEIVGNRDRALRHYETALDATKAAREAAEKAAPGGHPPNLFVTVSGSDRWQGTSLEEFRKGLDRSVWRFVMEKTGLRDLFDAEARRAFEKGLETDPPEATVETITATAFQLAGDAGAIFTRGLINAFRKLDRAYASHDAFRIKARFVMASALSPFESRYQTWNRYARDDRETINDLERIFSILDGKPKPEVGASIIDRIDGMLGFGFDTTEVETDYFRVRRFKNGSLHVWFRRDDLVEKANRMIAGHYGAALGDAS